MTDIRVEAFTMPAAPVGSGNPLPDLKTVQYVHSTVTVDPSLSEEEAKKVLLEKEIEIIITLGDGDASAIAWGCDLTYEYVKINGDYRT